ncbi:MAG: ankyrin repeat domain-containing protein [SAR324 cluster bacterium]|nr:ankyrin repeat domain-containing protein [SAR324 cluster bacterium]
MKKTINRTLNYKTGSWLIFCFALASVALAQIPPSSKEKSYYTDLFAAAVRGNINQVKSYIVAYENVDIRDSYGRTPLHVAAYGGHHDVMRILVASGADPNALENDRYDIVTIAAVANDLQTLKVALELGTSAKNITSRYDGTALIAAAHLGHTEVVQMLIRARAPLDHVNNLGWTALIESIVLGDGGRDHTETLRALINAGANVNLTDKNGKTPLSLAKALGYNAMVKLLLKAGAQ